MIIFDLDLGDTISVETNEKGGEIRFATNTLGIKNTKNGYAITNDWNNRHFTIAFDSDSVFYHITREKENDRETGSEITRREYINEMLGYLRYLAPAVPEKSLQMKFVGRLEIDEARLFLQEEGLVERINGNLVVNNEELIAFKDKFEKEPALLGKLFSSVLEPVPVESIRDSGEVAFIYPSWDGVKLIILYPFGEVGVADASILLDFPADGRGSPIINHVMRSIATE